MAGSIALYASGSNGSGQLGIGHFEDVSVPKDVILEDDLTDTASPQIQAGGNHTLMLFASGRLLWSGDATSAACGNYDSSVHTPARFSNLQFPASAVDKDYEKVILCAATWEASVIVTRDVHFNTKIYSFGTGNKGELGLGDLIFRTPTPQLIKDFPPAGTRIIDLAASVSHIVAVLDNGEVYGWGNGRKGQLGEPAAVVYIPRRISAIDFRATRAVCGRQFTFIVGDPAVGKFAVLGPDKLNVVTEAPSNVVDWKDIGAGWSSIYVLHEDGTMVSWGKDDHGQLVPPMLPLISQVAVGSEHVVVTTVDGEVLSWGWGEHGNCGPNTTNGDVKGRWNVVASSKYLPPGGKIAGIGAGCATSWICLVG